MKITITIKINMIDMAKLINMISMKTNMINMTIMIIGLML